MHSNTGMLPTPFAQKYIYNPNNATIQRLPGIPSIPILPTQYQQPRPPNHNPNYGLVQRTTLPPNFTQQSLHFSTQQPTPRSNLVGMRPLQMSHPAYHTSKPQSLPIRNVTSTFQQHKLPSNTYRISNSQLPSMFSSTSSFQQHKLSSRLPIPPQSINQNVIASQIHSSNASSTIIPTAATPVPPNNCNSSGNVNSQSNSKHSYQTLPVSQVPSVFSQAQLTNQKYSQYISNQPRPVILTSSSQSNSISMPSFAAGNSTTILNAEVDMDMGSDDMDMGNDDEYPPTPIPTPPAPAPMPLSILNPSTSSEIIEISDSPPREPFNYKEPEVKQEPLHPVDKEKQTPVSLAWSAVNALDNSRSGAYEKSHAYKLLLQLDEKQREEIDRELLVKLAKNLHKFEPKEQEKLTKLFFAKKVSTKEGTSLEAPPSARSARLMRMIGKMANKTRHKVFERLIDLNEVHVPNLGPIFERYLMAHLHKFTSKQRDRMTEKFPFLKTGEDLSAQSPSKKNQSRSRSRSRSRRRRNRSRSRDRRTHSRSRSRRRRRRSRSRSRSRNRKKSRRRSKSTSKSKDAAVEPPPPKVVEVVLTDEQKQLQWIQMQKDLKIQQEQQYLIDTGLLHSYILNQNGCQRTLENICAQIVARNRISFSDATLVVQALLGGDKTDGDEFSAVEYKRTVSLQDPILLSRIEIPARGIKCKHISCFDLMTHLRFHSKEGKAAITVMRPNSEPPTKGKKKSVPWKCPICQKPATIPNLRIDGYMEKVLQDSPEDTESCTIFGDGRYAFPQITLKITKS